MGINYDLVIVGGGAAGFFTGINAALINSNLNILILEKNREPLQKVKISGGGRCNLTNACFEPSELINNYPRGREFLLKPFERFGPKDTVKWFTDKGVEIKKENDGRLFPVSNSSQTILDCFRNEISKLNIGLRCSQKLSDFTQDGNVWSLVLDDKTIIKTKNLVLATGGDKIIWERLRTMSLKIIDPVPSLFTFKVDDQQLTSLAGTSFKNVIVSIPERKINGPLLITHWGLSGPAILKLSAFSARELSLKHYDFQMKIDFLPNINKENLIELFKNRQLYFPKKKLRSEPLFDLSKRFWDYICSKSEVREYQNWSETGKKHFGLLMKNLKEMSLDVKGKSTFKDEFVTAGGLDLTEISQKTFEVEKYPGLYMAGEVLNIDAVTGGFNFQAAWTGGWIIAQSVAKNKISQF